MISGHRQTSIQTDTDIEMFASPAVFVVFAVFARGEETVLNGATAVI